MARPWPRAPGVLPIQNKPLVATHHGPAIPPLERHASEHVNLMLCQAQHQVRVSTTQGDRQREAFGEIRDEDLAVSWLRSVPKIRTENSGAQGMALLQGIAD